MKTLGEGCRKRTKGPKIEAKGRKWGKVLGTGQQAPPLQLESLQL